MALQKKDLKAALVLLSVSFAADATNEVLEDQLSTELKEQLTVLKVEFPTDASTETLLELYNLATTKDDSGDGGLGDKAELPEDEEFFEFTAKVGFKQPWQGGMFSKLKDEEFDCDDDKLIKHLESNALIKRN